ncbi:MAG: hypothetical protein ACREJC_00290, partial [Tepidisphaeraceae bacterium]
IGPAYAPDRDAGVLIEFNPSVSISDKRALQRKAVRLWLALRAQVDISAAGFVVLRATDRPPTLQGVHAVHAYGFVIERRGDGLWYLMHDSLSIDERARVLLNDTQY